MSPQLSNMFYGFFPHSWQQHVREGHFRPIVFMQHGLMVSLWMAVSSVTAFWLWRSEQLKEIKNIPMGVVFILLSITCLVFQINQRFFCPYSRLLTLLLFQSFQQKTSACFFTAADYPLLYFFSIKRYYNS